MHLVNPEHTLGWAEVWLKQKYTLQNRAFYSEVAVWLDDHRGDYSVSNMARPQGRRYRFRDQDTAFEFKMRFG